MERIMRLAIEGNYELIGQWQKFQVVIGGIGCYDEGENYVKRTSPGNMYPIEQLLMDPELYKALGRQQGWDIVHMKKRIPCRECSGHGYLFDPEGEASDCYTCGGVCRETVSVEEKRFPVIERWQIHKARALATNDDGGSAEYYLISVLR